MSKFTKVFIQIKDSYNKINSNKTTPTLNKINSNKTNSNKTIPNKSLHKIS
jgi:hypothetical protein